MKSRCPKPAAGSRTKAIQAYYEPRISEGRAHFEILDWSDARSQQVRFEVLADNVDLRGKSLLDVGCGLGDLWGFLKGRKIPVDYLGVDISEKMVQAARRHQPDGRFQCADLFSDETFGAEGFDVVFGSGIFNLDLGNNRRFLATALGRFFQLSREYVVFNLLHQRCRQKYDYCAYFDPAEVVAMLADYPCQTRLLEDYLPNDFTVVCRITAA